MSEHGEAVQALLGHLDKDDINVLQAEGWDTGAETFVTYTKDLNIKRQFETMKLLDYGIDFSELATASISVPSMATNSPSSGCRFGSCPFAWRCRI